MSNIALTIKRQMTPTYKRLRIAYTSVAARFTGERRAGKLFVIYGRGRSGSTLFVDLLNNHPDVFCDHEVLSTPKPLRSPRDYILDRARLPRCSVYGFKLLSYQLAALQNIDDESGFLDWLEAEGFEIIYLYRRDILRHAVSNVMARENREFHRKKDRGSRVLELQPELLEQWMRGSLNGLEKERAVLQGRRYVSVCYEDDLEQDKQPTMDRVFTHLGLEPVPVRTQLRKIVTPDLSDTIANYAELKAHFRGTDFETYFV